MPARTIISKSNAIKAAMALCRSYNDKTVDGASIQRLSYKDGIRGGYWRRTNWTISGPSFSVEASRSMHKDGRIRETDSLAWGLPAFGCWLARNFQDVAEEFGVSADLSKLFDAGGRWVAPASSCGRKLMKSLNIEPMATICAHHVFAEVAGVVLRVADPSISFEGLV